MSKLIRRIVAYEHGELSTGDTLDLFSDLVVTGVAWQLQGCYGRAAAALIDSGLLDKSGNLTDKGRDLADSAAEAGQ